MTTNKRGDGRENVTRRFRLKPGDMLAGWRIEEGIGIGGNAFVYRVSQCAGSHFALKEPRTYGPDDEAYMRFCREVQILQSMNGTAGVMPLLDCHLPGHPTRRDRGYYVMPIMIPARETARSLPPEAIIAGARSVARTLSVLAKQGVAHRDIKPENIYMHEGQWVVGDFGLVKVPQELALTQEGGKLGPAWYIAPEMLRYSDELDASAADVYSLAKTLWVLLTGYGYPLPGPHLLAPRELADFYSLGSYVALRGTMASQLDSLLARATDMRPEARPLMAAFADELHLILRPEGERTVSVPVVGDIAKKLATATRRVLDEHQVRKDRLARHDEAGKRIMARLEPFRDELRDALGPTFSVHLWGGTKIRIHGTERIDYFGPLIDEKRYTRAVMAHVDIGPTPLAWPGISSGFCIGMDLDDHLYLYAFHILTVHPENSPDVKHTILWGDGIEVPCGSASEDTETERLLDRLKAHLPAALEALYGALNG